jgi:hypothetical protein
VWEKVSNVKDSPSSILSHGEQAIMGVSDILQLTNYKHDTCDKRTAVDMKNSFLKKFDDKRYLKKLILSTW